MTCEKQELQPIHAMTGIWDWMDWMDWLSLHGIACWSDSNWPYQRLKSGLYKLAMGIPVWGLLFLEACASFAKSQPHAVPGNQIGSRRATGVEPASKILYKSLLREVCKSIKILSPKILQFPHEGIVLVIVFARICLGCQTFSNVQVESWRF